MELNYKLCHWRGRLYIGNHSVGTLDVANHGSDTDDGVPNQPALKQCYSEVERQCFCPFESQPVIITERCLSLVGVHHCGRLMDGIGWLTALALASVCSLLYLLCWNHKCLHWWSTHEVKAGMQSSWHIHQYTSMKNLYKGETAVCGSSILFFFRMTESLSVTKLNVLPACTLTVSNKTTLWMTTIKHM